MTTSTLDHATVAQYLIDNPGFFEEHAALLGQVQLTSPLTGRAVSLQERQMEVMRGKYKTLEFQMADLIHTARDNNALHHKFHRWVQAVLAARNDSDLPRVLTDGLQEIFNVPQATLRLWRLAGAHRDEWYAQGVTEDARLFADSLTTPYCGPNNDFEAVRWLAQPDVVRSTVILPLRLIDAEPDSAAFGLLILGAEDAGRFAADMATDFLINIGETASAALTCLLD